MTTVLVRYEAMRAAVEQCARIDEAKEIKDKAAAVALYARQQHDKELARWMDEIQARAVAKIAVLLRALPTHPGPRANSSPQGNELPKIDAIHQAGLTKATAYKIEALLPAKEAGADGINVMNSAIDVYFAAQHESGKPVRLDGLRTAIRRALIDAGFADPSVKPRRKKKQELPADDGLYVDPLWTPFIGHIRDVAREMTDPDLPERMAEASKMLSPFMWQDDLASARFVRDLIGRFILAMEVTYGTGSDS